jgi:hypothetical protein
MEQVLEWIFNVAMKLLSRFANEYLAPVALSGKNRTTTLCREADDAPSNKIALYIDGDNLHATARTLGFEISTACARCWSVTVSSYDRRGVDSHVLRTPSDV